jgi:hypothetical protein
MARSNSTARQSGQLCPLPRYIQSLHDIATQAGLKASWKIERDSGDGIKVGHGEFIRSICQGTEQQFRNTHLLLPSYRFPLMSGNVRTTYGLGGEMTKVEDGYELVFDEPKPEAIETLDWLEILRYSDAYHAVHGTIEDLKACELITDRDLPRRGQNFRDNSDYQTGNTRKTYRQPDGTLLCRREQKESAACQAERRAEPDKRATYQTAEEYREWLISTVDAYRKLVPLDTKQTQSGHTCTIAFESTTAIEDALADLYWAYRNAVIHPFYSARSRAYRKARTVMCGS